VEVECEKEMLNVLALLYNNVLVMVYRQEEDVDQQHWRGGDMAPERASSNEEKSSLQNGLAMPVLEFLFGAELVNKSM